MTIAVSLLLLAQVWALTLVCRRLARGRDLPAPVEPVVDDVDAHGEVSVVLPARNEAHRIGPCLDGLSRQGPQLCEVIVVDGGSTDGTQALVAAAGNRDARIRCIAEPPRPSGTVGRPWAIAAGCDVAVGRWILIVDADTAARPGMIAGVVRAAETHSLDAVSFAPRIVAPGAGARWLQPAFLTTLVYRFGPPRADRVESERAMANGQCLLLRRDVLERAGGYGVARASYCDDIRIVRHIANSGARVGFLDGRALYDVVMYPTARETWRGWPESLITRDASPPEARAFDAALLLFAQALPIPLLLALLVAGGGPLHGWMFGALLGVNVALLVVRVLLSVATAPSFARRGASYWLAPLADPFVVLRLVTAQIRPAREWRGAPRPVPA